MYKFAVLILLINACDQRTKPTVITEINSNTTQVTADAPSQNPQSDIKFKWTDRRPIGMIMLASFDGKFKKDNQMNYMFDVKNFEPSLLSFAETCIKHMKKMNAQGMITWDIEGQQYAHPASYVGDPRFLPAQMELYADKYFRKFKDAGFKTGICIRPDRIEYNADKTWLYHYSVKDQYKNLETKIQYAIDRWGCSIFYIDSNVYGGAPDMDVSLGGYATSWWVFKLLHDKFPNILLVPEWKDYDYFRVTAPLYISTNKKPDGSPGTILLSDEHKKLLPNSFLVAAVNKDCTEIEASVKQGNVMLFPAWWSDPNNERIRKAYLQKK